MQNYTAHVASLSKPSDTTSKKQQIYKRPDSAALSASYGARAREDGFSVCDEEETLTKPEATNNNSGNNGTSADAAGVSSYTAATDNGDKPQGAYAGVYVYVSVCVCVCVCVWLTHAP